MSCESLTMSIQGMIEIILTVWRVHFEDRHSAWPTHHALAKAEDRLA